MNKPSISVTLFSAPGCHLCEEARAILERFRARDDLVVDTVNIRASIELERELGLRIPVARFTDGTELDWPFTFEQVASALRLTGS